jgi:hypothetical protein
MRRRQIVDEARRARRLPQTVNAPVGREENPRPALGAGYADIGEAALLLEAGAAIVVERALMRK